MDFTVDFKDSLIREWCRNESLLATCTDKGWIGLVRSPALMVIESVVNGFH